MNKQPWLEEAYKHLGVQEAPGTGTGPWIDRMWIGLGLGWLIGEAWCGGFVAHCMKACKVSYPKSCYRAKSWLDWGQTLAVPVYGCVGIMSRDGGGHVAFVVGKDSLGNIVCLGGNQRDGVRESSFDPARFIGFRYPLGYSIPSGRLKVVEAEKSKSEA